MTRFAINFFSELPEMIRKCEKEKKKKKGPLIAI